jgi:hypothetical protein
MIESSKTGATVLILLAATLIPSSYLRRFSHSLESSFSMQKDKGEEKTVRVVLRILSPPW